VFVDVDEFVFVDVDEIVRVDVDEIAFVEDGALQFDMQTMEQVLDSDAIVLADPS